MPEFMRTPYADEGRMSLTLESLLMGRRPWGNLEGPPTLAGNAYRPANQS